MDQLCVDIRCDVSILNNVYKFKYQINSLDCSKQPVWQFRLEKKANLDSIAVPTDWNYNLPGESQEELRNIIRWSSNNSRSDLNPNEILSGISLYSQGLPSLCKFYITGYVPLPIFPLGEEPEKVINNDIFENSLSGTTIAPREISNDGHIDQIIDSIIVLCDSSFSLGWIEDKSTFKKYRKLLQRSKNALNKEDTLVAKFNLFRVQLEVKRDSLSALSSEAYALIKFNTDWVIDQMPDIELKKLFDRLTKRINKCYSTGEILKKRIYRNLTKFARESKNHFLKGRKSMALKILRDMRIELRSLNNREIEQKCRKMLIDYSKFLTHSIK